MHVHSSIDETDSSYDGVRSVTVSTDAGNISVVGASGAGAHLHTESRWEGDRKAVLSTAVADGVLTVRARCPAGNSTFECRTDLTLEVPTSAAVTIRTGAGNAVARAVAGELRMKAGAGNLTAEDVRAPTVDASCGAGNIEIEAGPSTSGITANTGVGNVTVQVAADTPYRVRARSTLGRSQVDVPNDQGSSRSIEASSAVGNVTVSTG